MLYPDYFRDHNLYSLASGIANFLNVKRGRGRPVELGGRRLVLLLFDGLGWSTLQKSGFVPPSGSTLEKFTTVFPSTTSTVLTTLFTAQTPGEHGVLGYTSFSRKIGSTVIPIKYTFSGLGERDSLKEIGPFEGLFPGVKPYIWETQAKVASVLPKGMESSSFINTVLRGATIRTSSNFWDSFESLDSLLSAQDRYDFIYVYLSEVDFLSHKYGPTSWAALSSSRELLEATARMAERHRDYSFVVTADHGHVDSKRVFLNRDQNLLDMLDLPPYGDSRAIFMKSRREVGVYVKEKYPQLTLFGPDSFDSLFGGVWERKDMPDLVAVPKDESAFIFSPKLRDPEYEALRGHHGGLLPDELEIPVLKLNL
ncbi:nucleotide pyrophosphatase [Sulfodiicoccus acidiphilus]|uniref:Nucleotide pyrophosphatase n=1 Tax=Sulfodiicoccus acidiphilus TaxID=1670455 RepID=A0A348B272_9CREN|nr:alkaline phosphatase family protein [Sulfodiicoccus acidiphilus]BBD72274.1 nucleotide pyrophosphatase [Sulfodiicoccus acidiphilus]GGT90617.1 nucleotide pyrophosphatase [Sulfodiicoccus acidiphilus]